MKAVCGCSEDWICRKCLKCPACCKDEPFVAIHRNSIEASQRWSFMMRESIKSTATNA